MIDRIARVLGETTDDLLLVANDPGGDAWLPAVRRAADVRSGLGPLGGIHAALAQARSAVLVVAWDMPFVEAALLDELRRRACAGHLAVVPESAPGRLEPACAWYGAACREPIEAWLDSGRSSATGFLEECPRAHRVPVAEVARLGDPARLFFSINTPPDLKRAETLAVS